MMKTKKEIEDKVKELNERVTFCHLDAIVGVSMREALLWVLDKVDEMEIKIYGNSDLVSGETIVTLG